MNKIEFWHHHVGISVPDLEAALRWYAKVLGFECEKRFRIEAIPADCALISNGPLRLELFQPDRPQPLPAERRMPDTDMLTHGTKHPAFAVEDVPKLAAELERRGVDIVWVKTARSSLYEGSMYIRDNAGTLLEFVQTHRAAGLSASL